MFWFLVSSFWFENVTARKAKESSRNRQPLFGEAAGLLGERAIVGAAIALSSFAHATETDGGGRVDRGVDADPPLLAGAHHGVWAHDARGVAAARASDGRQCRTP